MTTLLLRARPLLIALLTVALASADALAQPRTQTVRTKYYEIETDLNRSEVREFGKHMDEVAEAYARMLESFNVRNDRISKLYLFRDQEGYIAFMQTKGFDARNTGGVFFVRGDDSGLATWVEGRPRSRMLHTLQHEGFHQFAHMRIGRGLPIWVNEGLAEYFGESLLVRGRLKTGIVPAHRLEALQRSIRRGMVFDLETMVYMRDTDWTHRLQVGDPRAGLMYDQAWSLAHFLINAEGGRYAPAFERFIRMTGGGTPVRRALDEAFGSSDLEPFEAAWRAYVLAMRPDPVSTAVERLDFLASGLAHLHERGVAVDSLEHLETELKRRSFRLTVSSHGLIREFSAEDDSLFDPPPSEGRGRTELKLIQQRGARSREAYPPMVIVRGLTVAVAIEWSRDSSGELVSDIVIR